MDAAAIGVGQLENAAARATAAAENVDDIRRGVDAIRTTTGVTKALDGLGIVSGIIDAGVAVTQAWNNPTAGNITKAVLKSGLAVLEVTGRVNPVAGIVIGILDLIGATDALFEW